MKLKLLTTPILTLIMMLIVVEACKKETKSSSATTATVTSLKCSSTTFSGTASALTAFTGTATVPYTGGSGVAYSAGAAIASTGVTGLTATLQSGTLASGAGSAIYTIAGTPSASGTATFAITFGGQTCSFAMAVSATSTTTTGCSTSSTTSAKVLCAVTAFEATLTTTQLAGVQFSYTSANAIKWSNLPCGSQCREGLELSTLTSTQLAAAMAVAAAATGTATNQGYSEATQIIAADDVLAATAGGSTYSSGNYFIAFVGTPSVTGTWQLQFGGHHLAINQTYNAGVVAGATPFFEGVEPKTWTSNSVTYAPLANKHDGMAAMLASFTTAQLATAKLSTTFSDVLLGPNTDGKFPAAKLGVAGSALTSAQQALVVAAMKQWVADTDDATAATLLATYTSEMAGTYISYSGSASGTSGSTSTFLTTNADYVRIDGPSVWIEFVCQTGVVFPTQIHYHSVWRDHSRDYGGNFTF